jgi:hypothetical protein
MGVVETSGILKAKPKQSVNPDMGGPNQSIGQQPELLVKNRECDEQERDDQRVDQVIKCAP